MRDSKTLTERKKSTRALNLLAAGGIFAIIALAGTAMLVIGPDDANATEIATKTVE